jgi:CHAT domain-containing protein
LRFKILEAESLLWRGMYSDALTLLESPPPPQQNGDLFIEVLALEGAAQARLHEFPTAEATLEHAELLCRIPATTCGEVTRSRGVLAVQRGENEVAKQYFELSLAFARSHQDRFLEITALLNIGLTFLRQERFDEAIEWTEAAYQAATALGADGEAEVALGNLGWAYYNLGDPQRSLAFSIEAEKRASQVENLIAQLSWITNAGYVYSEMADLPRAQQSYLRALRLATEIHGREDVYNAYRALALVSVEGGQLEDARHYCEEALAIARADNNRLNELYPLVAKASVLAQSHDFAGAEQIFKEIEADKAVNASLKWKAQYGLARLFDDEKRTRDADREYRAALATFEAARLSLRRNDAKLPFANNASRIYDDYVHFLVAQGKPDEALRWADYSRARTLAEGLGLLITRSSSAPPRLQFSEIADHSRGSILYYWLGRKQSYLWTITSGGGRVFTLPPSGQIEAAAQRYRKALTGPMDVLASANRDGRWLYEELVAPAVGLLPKGSRVFVIPDGGLNALNFETLLVPEPNLHYWIEDATVINVSSIKVLAASTFSNKPPARNLLLIGNSIAPNDKYPELPKAQAQMDSVATHFDAASRRVLARQQATPTAYLSSNPAQFSYIHFVAHGTANRLSPLDSAIILSKGSAESDSFKLYARDIIRQPLRADVVTISSCYGVGERTYAGEGLVGLSWAFLRAGAHNVIAALWEATDASTEQLMQHFYDELSKGEPPDVALHSAKLFLLKNTAFHNPFYWAPFQLYAGS